ncbi:MAG: hypothetical protein IKT32_02260 [Clostridia bacterium]|nr:hypothetical protein [Clostridia bacterium]
MAEILGKDLDNWDDSLAARQPYSLSESDTTGPQFMTGADLLRSARISSEWRQPLAIYTQAYDPMNIAFQMAESGLTKAIDSVRDLPYNVANVGAQSFIELTEGKRDLPDVSGALTAKSGKETLERLNKALAQSQQSIDEAIFLLKDRDYPSSKFARRVIADTTANVENRKIVRELYNQAHGIDSSKWYNEAASIIGAMLPAMAAGNVAFTGARAFGAGRLASVNIAKNIVKGYIGAEMAGQYAEETAAQYLARTGDKNFENFTAKDASGMMAAAYGAIGAQIEFMGGVEPIFAGALTKVGLRSSALKAAAKIGAGEATEELLQGLTETLMRKIDGTSDKTWKEGFEESLKGAAWGLFIGGTLGTTAFYTNRNNLVKGIKTAIPSIEDAQAELIADAMIDNTGEISSQDPSLRNNLRKKVELMYADTDIENKADRIDAITDLEYGLIAMDAAERGIELADHELFAGEVNELGWFRAGIPEERRVEIQEINDNIRDLKSQLAELNKAKEKDWAKIEEIENKLAQANQYVLDKLSDLARDDASAVRRMFNNLEENFAEKEKERRFVPPTPEERIEIDNKTTAIQEDLRKDGFNVDKKQYANYTSGDGATYLTVYGKGLAPLVVRIGVSPIGRYHKRVNANFNANMSTEEILTALRNMIDSGDIPNNRKGQNVNIGFATRPSSRAPVFQEETGLYEGETIVVDGKERTVYNSNGDRIAKSKEALTNFWKWFGNSKVVDEQGRPLVVYHGTNAGQNVIKSFADLKEGQEIIGFGKVSEKTDTSIKIGEKTYSALRAEVLANQEQLVEKITDKPIIEFNKKFLGKNTGAVLAKSGFFFSEDIEYTKPYGKVAIPVYLSVQNPYVIDAQGKQVKSEEFAKEIQKIKNKHDGFIIKNIFGSETGREYVAFEPTQIKSVDNRGTYSSDTGNIYWQNRVSGGTPATYRGAYIPTYRFILRANKMDASTLSHELAHDWFETNFARYRSGEATKEFMRAWGVLEKALGVAEDAKVAPRKASEAFARAYEAWIVQNEDWAKIVNVEDKDKDAVEKLMKDYQNDLRDIYNDISNPYFKQTWGKLGELKPELKAWFDRVVNITDLDVMVERGEMTEEEAGAEKLSRAIDTVIENTEDAETVRVLKEAQTLNDTKRYEVAGGNKSSLQRRLSALAREIDENNMLVKENYDTRRDMMAVAEAADNFVKTRLDDALAIINGQMAEVEGLYKEDIYTALERLAIETGDLGLIDELKNSEIANRFSKELGQRVAGFRNFKQSTDLDVVSALKSLDNTYNKALENKKAQKQFNEALDMLDKSLKAQDSIADKELDATLKELECK